MTSSDRTNRWAGLTLDRPRVMGILNVTPDSFSDGGSRIGAQAAISAGFAMAEAGADIIDVGGESTRPGADVVSAEAEQARILPVIRALAAANILVSVDTRNAATMRAALAAGARIINDISGLAHDPGSLPMVAEHGCPVVLMHMRGTPGTMSAEANYQDVVSEVRAELANRVDAALAAGILSDRIVIDPGLGFAKHAEHSLAVLRGLPDLLDLGYPVLIGLSRKSFIGTVSEEPRAGQRLGGSLAAGLFAVLRGASILRVHDVRETVQALRVWRTLFE
ncbi:MAG TPA: dihydropteroate synthase [Acetobacteraceae bacterium]|jgi:dihydropteroate synthase|nr:dihydropteroate synthase [Acetobacteraceae bacterium]